MFSLCTARNVSLNKSIWVLKERKKQQKTLQYQEAKSKIFQTRSHGLNSKQLLHCSVTDSSMSLCLLPVVRFLKRRLPLVFLKKVFEKEEKVKAICFVFFQSLWREVNILCVMCRQERAFWPGTLLAVGHCGAGCCCLYSGCVSPLLQSPFIPTARTGVWEVRVGDVYSEGARRSRRRCLLLRLLQWGYCSLCQTGHCFYFYYYYFKYTFILQRKEKNTHTHTDMGIVVASSWRNNWVGRKYVTPPYFIASKLSLD